MVNTIHRLPTVKHETGLCRSTIYAQMAKGKFPKQIKLSSRAVGWLASDIQKWIDEQIKTRDLEVA